MSTYQYHIACEQGDVGRYCILPGDPGRVEKIAVHLEDAKLVANNREYKCYTGRLLGELVSVVSTGIGGPSAAIAVEELVAIGADTFIRVGTCGGIATKVMGGDVVIGMSAVRQEGTTLEYAPVEYPATADFTVTQALVQAAEESGQSYHVGVVQSKDSFYGQHSPTRMPVANALQEKWEAWKALGVLASEMEAAAIFTVAQHCGARAGAVFHVVWNKEREKQGLEDQESHDTEQAIQTAIAAVKSLILQDKRKN